MDRTPACGVSVIPCGKAFAHANLCDLGRGCVCRVSRVPKEGDGGPGPGGPVLELSASIQQKADYVNVADKEGAVQRASVASSDACKTFGKRTRTFQISQMVDLGRRHSPRVDGQLQGYPILLRT